MCVCVCVCVRACVSGSVRVDERVDACVPCVCAHIHPAQLRVVLARRVAQVVLVDGEMFSWYGSRLLYSVSYFKNLHLKLA